MFGINYLLKCFSYSICEKPPHAWVQRYGLHRMIIVHIALNILHQYITFLVLTKLSILNIMPYKWFKLFYAVLSHNSCQLSYKIRWIFASISLWWSSLPRWPSWTNIMFFRRIHISGLVLCCWYYFRAFIVCIMILLVYFLEMGYISDDSLAISSSSLLNHLAWSWLKFVASLFFLLLVDHQFECRIFGISSVVTILQFFIFSHLCFLIFSRFFMVFHGQRRFYQVLELLLKLVVNE